MHQADFVPKVDARRIAHHRAHCGDDGRRLLRSCHAHAGPAGASASGASDAARPRSGQT